MIAIIDIETTGLEYGDEILKIGIQPLGQEYRELENVEELQNYKLVGHNIKFDLSRINHNHGLELKPYLDTMIIAYLFKPYLVSYGLKGLVKSLFKKEGWNEDTFGLLTREGKKAKEIAEVLWHFKDPNFINTEIGQKLWEAMRKYLQFDVEYTYLLFSLVSQLTEKEIKLAEFLTQLDFDIETKYEPFYLDQEELKKEHKTTEARLKVLKKELGTKINLNSPKQVVDYITNTLGMVINHRTKTGNYSASYDSIIEMLERYPDHPWLKAFGEYKKLNKIMSSFLKPWSEITTGAFKPRFSLTGTVSGRTSCSKPNIQQIPRGSIRRLFVAPEGYDFVEIDYSQMELRIAGEIAGVKNILDAYENDGDLHDQTTINLFHREDFSKAERSIGKTANFGLLYGMAEEGFVKYAKGSGLDVSLEEASIYRSKFFEGYPELLGYYARTKRDLRINGFVENRLGRRYKYDKVEYMTGRKSAIERSAINALVQGLASDILLISLKKVLDSQYYGNEILICGTVHDSILAYIKKGVDMKDFFEECMCSHKDLVQVKLKIDYENFGRSWQ